MFDDDVFSGTAFSDKHEHHDEDDYKRPSSTEPEGAASPMGQSPAPATSPGPAPAPLPTGPAFNRAAARGAGVSLLVAVAGLGAGAVVGGLWGAGAGLLIAGALRNGARAHKLWGSADATDRQDAVSSATMAAVGTAAGGYLAYRAYQEQRVE